MSPEDLLAHAQALNSQGEPYAMVTVVRTTPPTSAYVGAQAIVRADGTLEGTVGGGCAREVVVAAALEAMRSGAARLVLISNAAGDDTPTGVERHAMRCASNGEIELFVHPHTPAPLLLVLGQTPSAQQARSFATQCGFRVTDTSEGPDAGQVAIALVATQGEGDEDALQSALASRAHHVLLIASRRKAERLRAAMCLRGVAPDRVAAIQAPAGPDIGAHDPAHVALAAIVGAVACWQKAGLPEPVRPIAVAVAVAAAPTKAKYVNPVCGMQVDPREALHTIDWQGQQFHFCCDGCKLEFERNPARHAAVQVGRAQLPEAA